MYNIIAIMSNIKKFDIIASVIIIKHCLPEIVFIICYFITIKKTKEDLNYTNFYIFIEIAIKVYSRILSVFIK